MITLKLKISNVEGGSYDKFIAQYSNIIRYAYNRYHDNLESKEIISICKQLNNIELMDASFIEFACKDAEGMFKADKELNINKRIFGSKKSFLDRINNKISKDEWNKMRNHSLYAIGRASDRGNRKFSMNIINNNSILFKPNKNNHFNLNLYKLSKNHLKMLSKIELLSKDKKASVTYKLSRDYVYITFDEMLLRSDNYKYNSIKNRTFAIDLNPNYIGYSIIDYDEQHNQKIIETAVISIKEINDVNTKGLKSSDKMNIYLSNKRFHEVMEISKFLTNKAKHFNCELFIIEELNIIPKNHNKGCRFNKLINNKWIRKDFVSNLIKRCNIIGIKSYKVSPFYSSFIGQFNNPDFTDSISASIEINRRGYLTHNTKIKNKEFYANLIFPKFNREVLCNRWKKYIEHINLSYNWIDLYKIIKKIDNECYRFLFDDWKTHHQVFRLKTTKSLITFTM